MTTKQIATSKKEKTQKLSKGIQNLMKRSRLLRNDPTNCRLGLAEINKKIKKNVREDVRQYRNSKTEEPLKEGKSLKHLNKQMNEG